MFSKLCQIGADFLHSESGPTEVEYAVILGVLLIVCLTAIFWLVPTSESPAGPPSTPPRTLANGGYQERLPR